MKPLHQVLLTIKDGHIDVVVTDDVQHPVVEANSTVQLDELLEHVVEELGVDPDSIIKPLQWLKD